MPTIIEEAIALAAKGIAMPPEQIALLPMAEQIALAEQVDARRRSMRQEHQLLFYQPASPTARLMHLSMALQLIASGGNRSSKTDTLLAELVIQLTGIVPYSLEADYPRAKLRPPIRARVMCESLTSTLEPIIKPKLRWRDWNGRGEPGGPYGHWGWIPRHMLLRGRWDDSYSEKYRTLTLTNGSTVQFMSYTQELDDLKGGSYHIVLNDEGGPQAHYRENHMRTMDVGGGIYTALTPPDETSAAWAYAWIYDEVYERGLPGPRKDPQIDAFTLFTEDNRILDPHDIAEIGRNLSPTQREVRFHGRFLHLSGLIYPLFTDREQWWCFGCNAVVLPDGPCCISCASQELAHFCHVVEPFDVPGGWPVVMVLDPHDRKPHALAWYAIDPSDDIWQVAELELDAGPLDVRDAVHALEEERGFLVMRRLIDPNMGQNPSRQGGGRRGRTVRDDFDEVGLRCDLADDNQQTARNAMRELMKPDRRTQAPRFHVFASCPATIFDFGHYVWDEWSRYSSETHDPKPKAREKHDDFPACAHYLVNDHPTFSGLRQRGEILRRPGSVRP